MPDIHERRDRSTPVRVLAQFARRPAASSGPNNGRNATKSAASARCTVARMTGARTTVRSERRRESSSVVKPASLVQSPT